MRTKGRAEVLRTDGSFKKVPYKQAVERTGREPIGFKCVDVKKPDGKYRSRLVAEAFKTGINESLHAAMPPLEALNMMPAKFAAREQQGMAKTVEGSSRDFTCTERIFTNKQSLRLTVPRRASHS